MPAAEPRVPVVDLPRVDAAQFQFYDHGVGAFLVTADEGLVRWIDEFTSRPSRPVATDIETRGLDTLKYTITAVTVAFQVGADTVALLFDPLRRNNHRSLLARIYDHASRIVFHGGSFDIAPLYAHRLMTRGHIRKVGDTLVAARMIDSMAARGRALEDLATAYGAMTDDRTTMDTVFGAGGVNKNDGYWFTDIDCVTYAVGAMADTVATLRLWGVPGVKGHGVAAVAARLLTDPGLRFPGSQGSLTAEDAERVVEDVQRVNQIVMERTARGYNVDVEFPERFFKETVDDVRAAGQLLADAGVRPGNGADLVKALVASGDIDPALWKKTPTGQLKSDAKTLEVLETMEGHHSPLVPAHQLVAKSEKVMGYVTKAVENAGPTGRLHPEIKILGASATGRMSASLPEIQQFPDAARGVILADDEDWTSADWKSIEPVVLATAAGDRDFIAEMRAGKDPYEPVGKLAGIDRKLAKRKMLADMYGQGLTAAALQYGWSMDQAKKITDDIRAGLPILYGLINALKEESEQMGRVVTLSGRVLGQRFTRTDNGVLVTETASRRAPNHFCQGTALDVMHHAILELDRRGLSDKTHLWMHDEIVADASIAKELTEVMATPPPFLAAVADYHGMEAFLAVDINEVGRRWKAV